jgi:hypothetical protein
VPSMSPVAVRNKWPGPKYHIQVEFRAPLPFVYAWCTDYTARDAVLEGEDYQRKVIRRGPREVVYEDLEEGPDGWYWARHVVRLRPPSGWSLLAKGNRSEVIGDYRLTTLPNGRTRLDLRWQRRSGGAPHFNRRPKAAAERASTLGWRRFAQALEGDYRKSRSTTRR